MDRLRSPRGGRIQVVLPPAAGWKPLERARDGYTRLLAQRRESGQRLAELAGEREQALARDREALAKAIAAGKSEPDDRRVREVDEKIAAEQRRGEAIELALDQAEQELVSVVERHRGSWLAESERELERERAHYRQAVEALAQARTRLDERQALIRWLRGFPEQETSYRPQASPLRTLAGSSGEPLAWATVVSALALDATPEPEREPLYVGGADA